MAKNILLTACLPAEVVALARREHEVEVNEKAAPMEREHLLARLSDKQGLLCTITDRVDSELLEKAPRLEMIANYGVGCDNIDLDAVSRRGIPVSNTPDVLTEATAEIAFGLLLAVARRVVEGDRRVRDGRFGKWSPMGFLGTEASGKTLGVVGLGRIGAAVARRAKAFNMEVLYYNRKRLDPAREAEMGVAYEKFGRLIEESDFISLHVPLTGETMRLIGKNELSRMKSTAFLINTSRGPVVDERALVEALREGRIAGAGLDVYENEPRLAAGLAELPNTVLLPHVGSATVETRTAMAVKAVDNLLSGLAGKRPPDCLNWERLS